MFTVAPARTLAPATHRSPRNGVSIALFGLGHVGSAVAGLALEPPRAARWPFRITGALVRDVHRPRPTGNAVARTSAGDSLLDPAPDVIVEALGGLEPARTLVLKAIERRIPVVTANKSLLAVHGDEVFAAAAATGTPLRYEAAVLAGVPFLGTFARRRIAASFPSFCGVVNGTTNFILTEMAASRSYSEALADAQRRGFAEPDPSNDVLGIDAAQKLAILIRHFAQCSVRADAIEATGIAGLWARDLHHAAAFGGAIKPVVAAAWDGVEVTAFAGPAFVPSSHALARIDGVQNAILLRGAPGGDLLFAGPGAGPLPTAATILDDVVEAIEDVETRTMDGGIPDVRAARPEAPVTGWFIRLTGAALAAGPDISGLLGAHGVRLRRASEEEVHDGRTAQWLTAYPCERRRLETALCALGAATGCDAFCVRELT
jgi:homoserine dehydrogenase